MRVISVRVFRRRWRAVEGGGGRWRGREGARWWGGGACARHSAPRARSDRTRPPPPRAARYVPARATCVSADALTDRRCSTLQRFNTNFNSSICRRWAARASTELAPVAAPLLWILLVINSIFGAGEVFPRKRHWRSPEPNPFTWAWLPYRAHINFLFATEIRLDCTDLFFFWLCVPIFLNK